MMKQKSQTKSAKQSLKGTTESSRCELALKDKIASGPPWLAKTQQLLHRFFSHSKLEALINNWSYAHSVPALAYVCVEDVTFPGNTRK